MHGSAELARVPASVATKPPSFLSLSKREGAVFFLNQSFRHAHDKTIYAGISEVLAP